MKKLTILIDMDDTIERLLDAWLNRVNRKYGLNVTNDMITTWDVSEAYETLTRDQVYEVIEDETLWEEVLPIDGAPEALQYLMDCGHRVYLVTASSYSTLRSKMDNMLFKYFPFISWKQVVVISDKQLLHADVMIDDGEHNLIGGNYRKILFTASHNRAFDAAGSGMTRVDNWDEAIAIVNQIACENE